MQYANVIQQCIALSKSYSIGHKIDLNLFEMIVGILIAHYYYYNFFSGLLYVHDVRAHYPFN